MSENEPEYGHDQDAEPSLNAPGEEGPTGITAPEEGEDPEDPHHDADVQD
jgi:hypothetical protein